VLVLGAENNSLAPLPMIGRRIQLAREARGKTVMELSEKTKISQRYIEHIEAGEFDKLHGRSYVIGYTRTICNALQIDAIEVIYAIKSAMYVQPEREEAVEPLPRARRWLRLPFSKASRA
jgi:cytoskeletal protein RodZ